MKSKLSLTMVAVLILAGNLLAGGPPSDYLFKTGDTEIGGYVGTTAKVARAFSETALYGDLKAGVTINRKWTVGITGTGMHFDNPSPVLAEDGSYALAVNYGGMFIERILPMNKHMLLGLTFMSGQGTATYRYDEDYRKEKVWTEEIIDMTTFGVQELSLEIQHILPGNFWLGVYGSYRHTSPLQLVETSDKLLEGMNGGITLKYGIF